MREVLPPGSGQNHPHLGEREPRNSGSAAQPEGGALVVSFQRPLPSYFDRSTTWVSVSLVWF